jgi:hypothetical protein
LEVNAIAHGDHNFLVGEERFGFGLSGRLLRGLGGGGDQEE